MTKNKFPQTDNFIRIVLLVIFVVGLVANESVTLQCLNAIASLVTILRVIKK